MNDPLLNFSLAAFAVIGLHPVKRNVLGTIWKILELVAGFVLFLLVILSYVFNSDVLSIEEYCRSTETIVTVLQVNNIHLINLTVHPLFHFRYQ